MRASGNRWASAVSSGHFLITSEHAALQFEILKPIAVMGCFREPYDCSRR